MTTTNLNATQLHRPWRTTARTVFQVVVALAVGLPLLVDAAGISEAAPGVGTVLAVGLAVTRIMAMPWTEEFLQRFLPFLAAEKKTGVIEETQG